MSWVQSITMKYLIICLIFSFALSGCLYKERIRTEKTDQEIEDLLIGNWFVSPVDTNFYRTGNAISSYTRGHDVFFVAYGDTDCKRELVEVHGTWKVENRRLIIEIVRSTMPEVFTPGEVTTDDIISINDNNKVLKDIENDHWQLRTKSSTCMIETL